MSDILKRQKNIAAVSLIEIMMIFFIIAVVSVAGVSLNKPKQEYMRKIAVYSAYETLQNAVSKIVAEGHIDFTTDIGTCFYQRDELTSGEWNDNNTEYFYPTYGPCKNSQYNEYPGMNFQLTKFVSRAAKKDDGTPADPNISETAYSETNSALFLHLQDGFCQRLATAFQLDAHNINCPTDSSDNSHGSFINEIKIENSKSTMNYPDSFSNYAPSLYLPNGQVFYFSKYLYKTVKNVIGVETGIVMSGDLASFENWYVSETGGTSGDRYQCLYHGIYSFGLDCWMVLAPNELALKNVTNLVKYNVYSDDKERYMKDLFTYSKDYFNVYVDINGKMANAEDTASGPDRLNSDIFLFRVYRDGSVRPDYDSGFPKDLLLAKVLYKAPGATTFTSPASWGGKYASLPLVDAQCYANTSGTYSTYTISAFGQYVDYANLCPSIQPISDCIGKNGGTNCRVFINKPSFFIKN